MSKLSGPHRPFTRVGRMAMQPATHAAVLAASLSLPACAPSLDWREVHPPQADGLKAMFPCKPATHERQVPWPGLPQGLVMRMLSCQADEATWALSYVTVPDVNLIVPSLHEMVMMTRRNLAAVSGMAAQAGGRTNRRDAASGAAPGSRAGSTADGESGVELGGELDGGAPVAPGLSEQDLGPVAVPRMTPMPQAHAWRFTAQRPDGLGRPLDLDIRTWHFSHGMTVFQASVWRPASAVKPQSSEDVAQAFFGGLQFPL